MWKVELWQNIPVGSFSYETGKPVEKYVLKWVYKLIVIAICPLIASKSIEAVKEKNQQLSHRVVKILLGTSCLATLNWICFHLKVSTRLKMSQCTNLIDTKENYSLCSLFILILLTALPEAYASVKDVKDVNSVKDGRLSQIRTPEFRSFC